jgi:predicted Zn-dependent protease
MSNASRPQLPATPDVEPTLAFDGWWLGGAASCALACLLAGCVVFPPLAGPAGAASEAADATRRGTAVQAWERACQFELEAAHGAQPEPIDSCVEYAAALRATAHDEQVWDLLTQALNSHPGCAEFYELRADIAAELGFHRAAEHDYESVLQLQSERADVWQKLGQVRLTLGLPSSARTALSRSLELEPRTLACAELLALAQAQCSDSSTAAP